MPGKGCWTCGGDHLERECPMRGGGKKGGGKKGGGNKGGGNGKGNGKGGGKDKGGFDRDFKGGGKGLEFQAAMESMEQRILARIDAAATRPRNKIPECEVSLLERRITAKLDEIQTVTDRRRKREMDAFEHQITATQIAIVEARADDVVRKVQRATERVSAQIKESAQIKAEMLAVCSRLTDLEANMVCREDEIEAKGKRRHDEILRKVEELVAQVAKLGERTDQAFESVQASLTTEIQAAASRLTATTENLQSAVARQLAEGDAAAQRRAEEAAGHAQKAASVLVSRFDAVDIAVQKRGEASEQIATDMDVEEPPPPPPVR